MTSQTVAHVSTQAPTAAPAGVGGAASCFVAAVVAMLLLLPAAASGTVRAVGHAGRTPVVFFPGYSTTKLEVGVRNQVAAPDCPRSGKFEDFFGAPASTTFSQICRDRLLTLRYHPSRR